MKASLLVGIGGFLGAVARYKLGGWIVFWTGQGKFPAGTFAVNLVGCFVIGLLAGLADKYGLFANSLRLFLFTGLLGGFTTFSAFGLESYFLFQRGELIQAISYVLGSVLVGLLAVWLGMRLAWLL